MARRDFIRHCLKSQVQYFTHRSIGVSRACSGMTALTRSAKFFVCLLRRRVLPRMARPHRQPPKAEAAQHRADAALGQGHIETAP